jgi:hypothetical protein
MGSGVNLLEAREKLAAVLVPILDDDPSVLVSLVDAITPPALMLGWADPWLDQSDVVGGCRLTGHLVVTAVAARLAPGEGIAVLESLVDYVRTRLRQDPAPWQLESITGPRVFLIAKTNYLAARINVGVWVDG